MKQQPEHTNLVFKTTTRSKVRTEEKSKIESQKKKKGVTHQEYSPSEPSEK